MLKTITAVFITLFLLGIINSCGGNKTRKYQTEQSVNKTVRQQPNSTPKPKKTDIQLVIDSGGHKARINSVLFNPNGRKLYSVSDDKTIQVWSVASGKRIAIWRGQSSTGMDGQIFAGALSPDGKWLAVGGVLGDDGSTIRLHNAQTGEIFHLLRGHDYGIFDLAFSADSRYLLSGSIDATARLWDVKSGRSLQIFHGHRDFVQSVAFSPDGQRVVTGNRSIKIWDRHSGKLLKTLPGNHKTVMSIAFTPNGRYMLSSGLDSTIRLWDGDSGEFLKVLAKSESEMNKLVISPDGKQVVTNFGQPPYVNNIYAIPSGKIIREFTAFPYQNYVSALDISNDGQLVATGGNDDSDIHLWNPKNGKEMHILSGVGRAVFNVGFSHDGSRVGWGNLQSLETSNTVFHKGLLQQSLPLPGYGNNKTVLSDIIDDERVWNRSIKQVGDLSITIKNETAPETLLIKRRDKVMHRITNNLMHKSLTLTPDGSIVLSGDVLGNITSYDSRSGKILRTFAGHTGPIWSIAPSPDGRYLISGSDDQTVKLWEIDSGKLLLTIFASTEADAAGNRIGEWVSWTPEGFFDASADGAKFIGYQINRGEDKKADYVSVEQVYNNFYRPDLIAHKFSGKDITSYVTKISQEVILGGGLAPQVTLLSPSSGDSKDRDVTLRYKLCDVGGGIGNVVLRLNGQTIGAVNNKRGIKLKRSNQSKIRCIEQEKLISLQQGDNRIAITAFNKKGGIESLPAKTNIKWYGATNQPELHIVAIAVDKYRDADLQLQFSKRDAQALMNSLKQQGKKLFRKVHLHPLFDDNVRKTNIQQHLDKVAKQVKPDDVFIFYLAGHGITSKSDGNYYFLPVNFRYTGVSSIKKKALSNDFFQKQLSKISAQKSLILLDTCNSGSFQDVRTRGMEEKTAVNRLVKATGRATLMASSKTQVALEGYNNHGVFTWVLLEALRGKGFGTDNQITVSELANYVEETLPELTYSHFGYEQIPQKEMRGMNFPIGLR